MRENIIKMRNREKTISYVLNDLYSLKQGNFSPGQQYAIDENILFFQAVRSIFGYLIWLFRRAPNIKQDNLLELTDLPFQYWDQKMHLKLIELEKKKFPGLIEPLVKKIRHFIQEEDKKLLILVDFGSGGMEAERQVIARFIKNPSDKKIIIIGFDKSSITHEIAKQNLGEFHKRIIIKETEELTPKTLQEIVVSTDNKIVVVLAKNNIFELERLFTNKTFDLIFHSLFKHHLSITEKKLIDKVCINLSKNVFEYDGYKNWFHILLPHTITGWHDPVFLNATIFSDLRYFTRRELKKMDEANWHLSFFIRGTYLRQYH